MTQVDFYLPGPAARDNRFGLACRLADKAYRQGHRVYLHAASAEQARHLDRLLWTCGRTDPCSESWLRLGVVRAS